MTGVPEALRLFDYPGPLARPTREDLSSSRPNGRSLLAAAEAARLVAQAQAHFAAAVVAARCEGWSWRRIGTATSVPYQSLHRRFSVGPFPQRDMPGVSGRTGGRGGIG